MDRPLDTPDPASETPPGDRTQTLQSRDRPGRTTVEPEAVETAATMVARGTPSWNETTRTNTAQLPIDDPERYSLVGEHARGGLGRVVRAHDRRLGRTVAVKELLKKSDTAEALFVREALITARLQHPGIVPVIEAGRWPNGEPYYVMKLVEGRSLKELIGDQTNLTGRLALLPHVIAVAEAIGYAHSQDVIHRDVKPANVVVGEFGETVVVDWGLARDGKRPDSPSNDPDLAAGTPGLGSGSCETVSGRVIGTPQYMSPEQARGDIVDARADVYSLGALLYEVLAGVAPYAGGDADAILRKVLLGPPRLLAEAAPGVPDDLVAIVTKAMARLPDHRYPNAKELAEDLKRYATGKLVTAHSYRTMQLVRRWIARNRGPVAVAAVGALIMVMVGIGMVRRIVEERNLAERERSSAEQARGVAEDHSNALRALQAESSVRRDPTATVAWLKQYDIDAERIDEAAMILEEALASGVARHVFRESDWVYDVAFSPDGKLVSTGSKDGVVRLYDVDTGAVRLLGEHDGGVMRVAFFDGGRALLTGGLDGKVLAWPLDAADVDPTPRPIASLRGAVSMLQLTDGGVLRVWTEDQDHGTWQMPGGEQLFHLETDDPAIIDVVTADMSPTDPSRWLVGYADGRLALMTHGKQPQALPRLPRPPRLLSFSPDGSQVAVFDGVELRLVDPTAPAGTPGRVIGEASGPVRFLTWSADGTTLAVGGEMPELMLFATAVDAGIKPRTLRGHGDSIYLASFTRDGRRILTASDDATARVWDLVTGNVEVLRGHDDDVVKAAFSPDETMVATASLDGSARLWRVGSSGVRVLGGDIDAVYGLQMLDDHTAVSVSSPFQVLRWDLRTGTRAQLVPRGDDVSKWLAMPGLSRRGDVATSPGTSGDIHVRLVDGTEHVLHGHLGKVVGGGFNEDGSRLISAGFDGTVRRWDLATGKVLVLVRGEPIEMAVMSPSADRLLIVRDREVLVHGLDGTVLGKQALDDMPPMPRLARIVFSEDGRTVVIAGKNGRIVQWVPETGELHGLEDIGHHATNLAFSPDGRSLAGSMADRTVRIWDVATGALRQTLRGHVDLVMNVAYSPDGSHLASTSYDRTVRIWNVASGHSRVLRGHSNSVETVAWIDDGTRLVTAGRDGTIRVWPMPSTATPTPDALRQQIDRATTAVISAGERLSTPAWRPVY